MFCSLSGEVPEEPVVCKTTGNVFEKRLIEKYLDSEGKCPTTGEPLSKEDLLPLKTNKPVKPRPLAAASVPGLLGLFQNEWDDLMLETYTLKTHLDAVRQELSQALYQHDAACRVIARLVRERDEARGALTSLQSQVAQGTAVAPGPSANGAEEGMEVEGGEGEGTGISSEVVDKMIKKGKERSKSRKKRTVPEGTPEEDVLKEWKETGNHSLHKSNKKGVTALDVSQVNSSLLLSGGVDTDAKLFDKEQGKVLATLSGHSKKITSAIFHPSADSSTLFTASADKTVKIWTAETDTYDYSCAHTLSGHTGEVRSVSVQPTGDYVLSAGADGRWCFADIDQGRVLSTMEDPEGRGYGCAEFHPDGLIMATGTEGGKIRIWDMKASANVANFEGHAGGINAVSFSENGYYMASAGVDSTVRLWDLRKLRNFRILSPVDVFSAAEGAKNDVGAGGVAAVRFDFSGKYLAVAAGSDIGIYSSVNWEAVTTLSNHKAAVTSVAFAKDTSFLASASMDRMVKTYA